MSGVIAAVIRTASPCTWPADAERGAPIAGRPRNGFARMPKSLAEYSADDWRHLRPVAQAVKSLRYRVIDRSYRRRPARIGDPAALLRSIRSRKVLVHTPAAIARYVVETTISAIVSRMAGAERIS